MDLRKPSGWFFTALGVLLIATGVFLPEARAPLTAVNINLYSGIVMVAFGGILLWLARRAS
jgi:uncharacterized membrane protein